MQAITQRFDAYPDFLEPLKEAASRVEARREFRP